MGIGGRVRERIVRLNPKCDPGQILRGWHPAQTARNLAMVYDVVGKGEFVRRHGRAAWDAIPNGLLYKFGRRRYIGRASYLDNIWMIWAGLIPPCQMVAWYPTKKYANDKDCAVELISRDEFLNRMATA